MDEGGAGSATDKFFDGRDRIYWQKRTIAIAFLVLVLVIQGAYAARPQPQPYPAVILPGFRQPTTDWHSEFVHVAVKISYDDGTQLSPYLRDLYTNLNYASIGPTVQHAFDPAVNESPPNEAVKDWLKREASALHPESRVRSVQFCWRTVRIDVRGPSSDEPTCDRVREVTFD